MISPRPAVRDMAPYSPPTAHRLGKLRMDFNENTVGCSPRVLEVLKAKLTPESLSVYPDYQDVKAALSRHFGISPNQMLLTNGTDEAIHLLVGTYVNPNDQVVITRPSYAMYRFYAELAGATVQEVSYEPPDFVFPDRQFLRAITPATRAAIVSNPNNPTGTAIDPEVIEAILTHAPDAAVMVDEAYFEFHGMTALPLIERHANLFVSRTFSKVYGMAALRIGVLFSQEANVSFLHKAQSPYSVNGLAALAVQAAVDDQEYVATYVAEVLAARGILCAGLEKLGICYVASSANFVLALVGDRAIEIRDALRDHAILVRDRSYEINGGVRITVGTCEQTRHMLATLEGIW